METRRYIKAFLSPLNYIDIEWSSFSGYLNHVGKRSKRAKSTVKYEINKNHREGVVIKRLEQTEEYEVRMYELLNQNWLKYNHEPFAYKTSFFRKLKENLGENVVFYASLKNGTLTGVSILLKMKETGYIPFAGVDHETAGNDFTYFNVVYYRPIKDAISEKMTRLYYGRQMYELKARRGCSIINLYTYHRPFRSYKNLPVKWWFSIVSMRIAAKLPKNVKRTI